MINLQCGPNFFNQKMANHFITCGTVLKTLGGSTKGLHTHLKSKHSVNLLQESATKRPYSQSVAESSPGSSRSSQPHRNLLSGEPPEKRIITDYFKKKDNFDEVLSRMTALDGLPFSIFVKSQDMRNLFLSSGYTQLPTSETTIRNHVVEYSKQVREKIKGEILAHKAKGDRFSLTFDEWTSNSNKRFMNINVHTTNQFWSLGLLRISGSLTAEACVDLLKDRLQSHNISMDDDVVAIVTDGPNVMKKVGRLLPVKHHLCYAHGLHLAICDVLYKKTTAENVDMLDEEEALENLERHEDEDEVEDELLSSTSESNVIINPDNQNNDNIAPELTQDLNISEVITKVRKIVVSFKRSPTKNELVLKYMKSEIGKELGLILDVKTRWNSLLAMIERFLLLKSCILKALIDLKINIILNDREFNILEDIVQVLSPVK